MTTEIRGVHYDVTEEDKEYIDKKMQRILFAEGDIISLHIIIGLEKKLFKIEGNVHFRWGHESFVHVDDFDIFHAIDKLIDKMETQISKEKDKVKRH